MAKSTDKIDFLPHEKQGMARVVCDELARLTYLSSNAVFISRLLKLRELSEEWALTPKVMAEAEANGSRSIKARSTTGKGMVDVVVLGKVVQAKGSNTPRMSLRREAQNLENGTKKQLGLPVSQRSPRSSGAGVRQSIVVVPRSSTTKLSAAQKKQKLSSSGHAVAYLQCPHCPRKFCFQGNLLKHCEMEHGEFGDLDESAIARAADPTSSQRVSSRMSAAPGGVSCPMCSRKFYYMGCLQKHQEQHHGLRKMPATENALSAWLQTQPAIAEEVAQATSYHCTECDRSFESLNALCWHVRIHYVRLPKYVSEAEAAAANAELPYQCPVCERHFATDADLTTHLVDNADAHECADCGRRIETAFYLRVHQMTHRARGRRAPGGKPAHEPSTCPICGRTIKSNLHDHMSSVHAPTKKFVCDVCAKQCSRRSQLTRHMLTHGGERRFECGKCGRRFLLRDMMRRHMRAVHARLRPHLCNLCGRPFAEKHQLNTHMKVHRV